MDPIKLEGKAFELGLELKVMNEEHDSAHEQLKEEYKRKSDEICAIAKSRHNDIWSELNKLTQTSGSADLGLDTEYADQGVIFLKEKPKEGSGIMDGLASLIGELRSEAATMEGAELTPEREMEIANEVLADVS